MTRSKNATFAGVSIYDADADAPSYTRAMLEIAQDVALVYDKVTGENGEAEVIKHDGVTGRGSPLRFPIVQNMVDRSITIIEAQSTAAGKLGGVGRTFLWAAPIYCGPGDRIINIYLDCTIDPSFYFWARLITLDGNWTVQDQAPLRHGPLTSEPGEYRRIFRGSLDTTSSGLFLLVIEVDLSTVNLNGNTVPPGAAGVGEAIIMGQFNSVTVKQGRWAGRQEAPHRSADTRFEVTAPPLAVSAAGALTFVEMQNEWFADAVPLNAYLTANINRNLNGLEEYITGYPCGGNQSYVQEDQDGAGVADNFNPQHSRFMAHTRKMFANEPLIKVPLFSEGMGAIGSDGFSVYNPAGATGAIGMATWFAPSPTGATWPAGWVTAREMPIIYPDFIGTGTTNFDVAVLVAANGGGAAITNWSARINNMGGATAGVAFAAGGPALSEGANFGYAIIPNVTFTGDNIDTIQLQLEKTVAGAPVHGDLSIVGWAAYFDP